VTYGDTNHPKKKADAAEMLEKDTEEEGNSFVLLQEQPRVLNMDTLRRLVKYPEAAKEKGIAGKVVVQVKIDERGRYLEHKVVRDPDPLLTAALTRWLHVLRFTPARKMSGELTPCWVNIPFYFTPDDH
jgi:TonB family protein